MSKEQDETEEDENVWRSSTSQFSFLFQKLQFYFLGHSKHLPRSVCLSILVFAFKIRIYFQIICCLSLCMLATQIDRKDHSFKTSISRILKKKKADEETMNKRKKSWILGLNNLSPFFFRPGRSDGHASHITDCGR